MTKKDPGNSEFIRGRRQQKQKRRLRMGRPPKEFIVPWERGARRTRLSVPVRTYEREALRVALGQINPRQRSLSRMVRKAINEYLANRGSWFRLEEGKESEE